LGTDVKLRRKTVKAATGPPVVLFSAMFTCKGKHKRNHKHQHQSEDQQQQFCRHAYILASSQAALLQPATALAALAAPEVQPAAAAFPPSSDGVNQRKVGHRRRRRDPLPRLDCRMDGRRAAERWLTNVTRWRAAFR